MCEILMRSFNKLKHCLNNKKLNILKNKLLYLLLYNVARYSIQNV
jgi:hypothetical protein